jgi:mannan endo-1,4-beta-mannosidase
MPTLTCMFVQTRAANPGTRQMVSDTLDGLLALGLTVIRTWAFNDGPQWMALQPAPGDTLVTPVTPD